MAEDCLTAMKGLTSDISIHLFKSSFTQGAVKVLKTFTIHMKYKVFFNSVPSKVLKAEREIYKPGTARMVSCKLYVLDRLDFICL